MLDRLAPSELWRYPDSVAPIYEGSDEARELGIRPGWETEVARAEAAHGRIKLSARVAERVRNGDAIEDVARQNDIPVWLAERYVKEWECVTRTPKEEKQAALDAAERWAARLEAEYLAGMIPADKAIAAFTKLDARRGRVAGYDSAVKVDMGTPAADKSIEALLAMVESRNEQTRKEIEGS